MLRPRTVAALLLCVLPAAPLWAEPLPLNTAQGTILKVDRDTLTVRPRGPDGKFQPNLVLRLTGTSRVSTLTAQMRAGNLVLTQKDTAAKDLKADQPITVIYHTDEKGNATLAVAVVQPLESK